VKDGNLLIGEWDWSLLLAGAERPCRRTLNGLSWLRIRFTKDRDFETGRLGVLETRGLGEWR